MRSFVSAWILAALLAVEPAHADELQTWFARVEKAPKDVDARLQLALRYSWAGQLDEARTHAEQVVEEAPDYWDAHVLLARIDAWQKRYPEAEARLETVLEHAPNHREAKELRVDVALWSGDVDVALAAVDEELASIRTAAMYYRRAQIQRARLHYWAAWESAGQALDLDPNHRKSQVLRENTRFFRGEFVQEFEHIPNQPTNNFNYGLIVSGTLLPRAFLSVTLVEEYRYRFGTDNNQLTAQLDYRMSMKYQLAARIGFGAPANVVPSFTAGAAFNAELLKPLDATFGYRIDMYNVSPGAVGLQPGSSLHRWSADAGLRLPARLRAEAGYSAGFLLPDGGAAQDVHGLRLKLHWEPGKVSGYIGYAFGVEVDRPLAASLNDLNTHDISGNVRMYVNPWLDLVTGLGTQIRLAPTGDTAAIRFTLGARVEP